MYTRGAVLNEQQPFSLAGKKVLVVEDEYLIALDIEDMLLGLEAGDVQVAGTFDEAVVRIERNDFDLAILDVNLNGVTSFPLADMLKKRGRPFIFASGYNLDRRNDFEPVDAVCVAKPYDQQSLSEALGVVLGKAA